MALLIGHARRAGLLGRAAVACALLAANPSFAGPTPETTVSNATELIEALKPEQPARRIRLRAGRYTLETPLLVPDGVELAGAGVLRLDPEGAPAGFEPGTETVLVASKRLQGDVVTLGNGALLHGMRIEGAARDPAHGDAIAGNVVMIASRRPDDRLQAILRECEIVNHGEFGYSDGPAGRAVVVMTRNPDGGAGWHEGARVSATIERSIVRNTSNSNSIFAINFASGGTVALDLERNRFEGSLGVTGGVGRPDRVKGAHTVLHSRSNLYISSGGGVFPIGWTIIGGSVSPHHPLTEGAESNTVRVDSNDDRIEGYRVGILAAAGRPIDGVRGVVKHNRGELLLSRLRIRTVGDGAADLSLHGALMEDRPGAATAATTTAEDNVLLVTILDSVGSGRRDNVYRHTSPPDGVGAAAGTGSNRLEFAGSRAQFLDSNSSLDPAPDTDLFPATD